MNTILLVEDNPHIMKINANLFCMRDFHVLQAKTAAECEKILLKNDVKLIILDIMLPDGNGVELCKRLRKKYDIPILFLSALGESEDVIAGLKAGGDDYLAKPYDLEVLVARAEARLRTTAHGDQRFITYGKLKLDTVSMYGYIGDRDLLLTPKEFLLLLQLVKHAEMPVDKEQLYRNVWGSELSQDSHALYTTISRVKKKLDTESSGITVTIRRAEGYLLEKI